MLRPNVNAQLIGMIKVNEHNSAIGKTPPVIINVKAGADADTEVAYLAAYKTVLTALCVPNSFAGVSLRPSAAILGTPSWIKHDTVNDWPEADQNRSANVLLSNTDRTRTSRLQIPYLANAVDEAEVITQLTALLGGFEVYPTPFSAAADRLDTVLQVQITRR